MSEKSGASLPDCDQGSQEPRLSRELLKDLSSWSVLLGLGVGVTYFFGALYLVARLYISYRVNPDVILASFPPSFILELGIEYVLLPGLVIALIFRSLINAGWSKLTSGDRSSLLAPFALIGVATVVTALSWFLHRKASLEYSLGARGRAAFTFLTLCIALFAIWQAYSFFGTLVRNDHGRSLAATIATTLVIGSCVLELLAYARFQSVVVCPGGTGFAYIYASGDEVFEAGVYGTGTNSGPGRMRIVHLTEGKTVLIGPNLAKRACNS